MSNEDPINRRKLLSLFTGASLALLFPSAALAKDGEDDSSDDGDSGSDSSDNDNSDSGDDSGDDDGDDGDDGNDDSEDDDSGDDSSVSGDSGSGSSGSGKSSGARDQDKVKDAVLKGDAIPLAKALALLKGRYKGRVIEILYAAKGSRIDYRFKLLDDGGKVISVTMDARTGRLRGFFGF